MISSREEALCSYSGGSPRNGYRFHDLILDFSNRGSIERREFGLKNGIDVLDFNITDKSTTLRDCFEVGDTF